MYLRCLIFGCFIKITSKPLKVSLSWIRPVPDPFAGISETRSYSYNLIIAVLASLRIVNMLLMAVKPLGDL